MLWLQFFLSSWAQPATVLAGMTDEGAALAFLRLVGVA
jgi:hypothetical protein